MNPFQQYQQTLKALDDCLMRRYLQNQPIPMSNEQPDGGPVCAPEAYLKPTTAEDEIKAVKQCRKDLDKVLQSIRAWPPTRERALSITYSQNAIMWLGMDLKRLAALQPPEPAGAAAKAAYHRYGSVTDFKNFQGNPMPKWEELPEKIREAWKAAINTSGAPYPTSYDPTSTRIEPTADGLKL